jgi:hypothetical protein
MLFISIINLVYLTTAVTLRKVFVLFCEADPEASMEDETRTKKDTDGIVY